MLGKAVCPLGLMPGWRGRGAVATVSDRHLGQLAVQLRESRIKAPGGKQWLPKGMPITPDISLTIDHTAH